MKKKKNKHSKTPQNEDTKSKNGVIYNYIIATRPWSFTASVIPILIASALLYKTHPSQIEAIEVLRVLMIIVFVQAGANLTNTYYDFVSGVDNKKTIGDRTLVDKLCNPDSMFKVSVACYVSAFALFLPKAITILNET